jgi:hypothetical protein
VSSPTDAECDQRYRRIPEEFAEDPFDGSAEPLGCAREYDEIDQVERGFHGGIGEESRPELRIFPAVDEEVWVPIPEEIIGARSDSCLEQPPRSEQNELVARVPLAGAADQDIGPRRRSHLGNHAPIK